MAKKDFAKTMKTQGNILLQSRDTSSNQSITDLIASDAVKKEDKPDKVMDAPDETKEQEMNVDPEPSKTKTDTEQKPKQVSAASSPKENKKASSTIKASVTEKNQTPSAGGKRQLCTVLNNPKKERRVSFMISELAYENLSSLTERYGFRSQNECMNYLLNHINEFIE